MRKINYISLVVVFFGILPLMGFSQIPEKTDTGIYYVYSQKKHLENGDCVIDYKTYPKEICSKIEQSYLDYESATSTFKSDKSMKRDNIFFMKYLRPDGILEHTEYNYYLEIGPFGEYVNYFSDGKTRSTWQFEEPNDSLTNYGVMTGDWWYFNEKGDTVGVKRFKNGLAHGKWVTWTNDSTRVIRGYKNGLSDGTWNVDHYTKYSSSTRPYIYHNGFYSSAYRCYEKFETFLDEEENTFQKNKIIVLEEIKYGTGGYIENGKFQIVRDGIIIAFKEFKEGDLVKHIKYDYK